MLGFKKVWEWLLLLFDFATNSFLKFGLQPFLLYTSSFKVKKKELMTSPKETRYWCRLTYSSCCWTYCNWIRLVELQILVLKRKISVLQHQSTPVNKYKQHRLISCPKYGPTSGESTMVTCMNEFCCINTFRCFCTQNWACNKDILFE